MTSSSRLTPLMAIGIKDRLRRAFWRLAWVLLYRPTPIAAHRWRRLVLLAFGAQIAWPVYPYPSARIWAPWNLKMLRGSCLAGEVDCYNVDKVTLCEGVTVSQKSFLCTASHAFDDQTFELIGGPIVIGHGAWVAADAFIGPGVDIGEMAVVLARSVVVRNVEPGTVVGGNPARMLRWRAQFGTSILGGRKK